MTIAVRRWIHCRTCRDGDGKPKRLGERAGDLLIVRHAGRVVVAQAIACRITCEGCGETYTPGGEHDG